MEVYLHAGVDLLVEPLQAYLRDVGQFDALQRVGQCLALEDGGLNRADAVGVGGLVQALVCFFLRPGAHVEADA